MEGRTHANQIDHHGHRLAAATAAVGIIVVLVLLLGWLGVAIGALGTATVLVVYWLWTQPWQHR